MLRGAVFWTTSISRILPWALLLFGCVCGLYMVAFPEVILLASWRLVAFIPAYFSYAINRALSQLGAPSVSPSVPHAPFTMVLPPMTSNESSNITVHFDPGPQMLASPTVAENVSEQHLGQTLFLVFGLWLLSLMRPSAVPSTP